MPIVEVTYYQMRCDCCDEVYDGDDYSAYASEDAAIDAAQDGGSWKQVNGEWLCNACWIDEEDMEGFEGEVNDDYVPVRRHVTHGDPDLEWGCQHKHPETGQPCVEKGVHEIHSASVESGPDWKVAT